MNIIKPVLLLGLASVLAGCKVGVIVPEGGTVQSLSNTRNCPESRNCFHQVNDTTFTETFTAVPNVGWQFIRWNSGSGFFCEDSVSLTCTMSTVGLDGVAGALDVIASDTTFYIMPLFKFVGIDTDGDGIKDHIDEDDDNDGVLDIYDAYPLDPDKSSLADNIYALDGSDGKITASLSEWWDCTIYSCREAELQIEGYAGTFGLLDLGGGVPISADLYFTSEDCDASSGEVYIGKLTLDMPDRDELELNIAKGVDGTIYIPDPTQPAIYGPTIRSTMQSGGYCGNRSTTEALQPAIDTGIQVPGWNFTLIN